MSTALQWSTLEILQERCPVSWKALVLSRSTPSTSQAFEMDTLPDHRSTRVESKTPASDKQRSLKRDYTIGVVLFLVVILLWTISGFVTQILYRNGYDKPFLVTYISTSPFALYLIPRYIQWRRARGADRSFLGLSGSREGYQSLSTSETPEGLDDAGIIPDQPFISSTEEKVEDDQPPLTVEQTAKIAFGFCWLWFIANWAVNAALNYTTVASSTIVTSTSGFFTLGFGRMFGVERLTMMKVAAVFTSFIGVVLVSVSDLQPTNPAFHTPSTSDATNTNYASQPLFGDALALISALFYAMYVVFLKVKIKDESRIDMRLFLGFVGLFNLLTCWPVGVLLHWLDVERFQLPDNATQWYALLANMGILVFSDYLYILAMLKTTPLLVTIGISLTIPFAVVGDFILNAPVQGQVIVGASLVLLAFIAIGSDKTNVEGAGAGDSGRPVPEP
ncbi:hypothetical protein P691DRAFT_772113 [Macrolepiota fuliginosa MF-IS2]|uniref:EamA domain-containing protein n=1 Tax=Macrolepiota fuliginosa MF-IS2 TaxID=1400762 RepID=A0A9P6C883_9AGAR|nr:hypothetical protein P691DRAFT_772113 [Macrolepiota fuliginosa MF-IS2]